MFVELTWQSTCMTVYIEGRREEETETERQRERERILLRLIPKSYPSCLHTCNTSVNLCMHLFKT